MITDATWHHFININLVGEAFPSPSDHPSKAMGFLYSAFGQNHFSQIKHYFINIAVWISRPANLKCFRTRWIWELVYHHRVLEATMDHPTLDFPSILPGLLYAIGTHAADVLGKSASQCRRLRLILDLIVPTIPELIPKIDP